MKPIASVSLDLDNQWSYLRSHGDKSWEEFPSYLDTAVPRILEFLSVHDLKITFFIVGKDASLEKNRDSIRSISDAGHEIANHSFMHEPWLHLYTKQELIDDLEKTEDALLEATGKRPKGFRGPGFSLSPTVLEVLGERGYEYDCSTLPTFAASLARAFFFLKSPKVSAEEKERLKKLFGKFSDGFQTLKPHSIDAAGRDLVEIPVTTFPFIKTPIHVTYLMYLTSFSNAAARLYWKSALTACKLSSVEPSLLLHPLDLLSGEDVPELKFFPGMNVAANKKRELLDLVIDSLDSRYDIVTMREHADATRARGIAVRPAVATANVSQN